MYDYDQRSNTASEYIHFNGKLVARRSAPLGSSTYTTRYLFTDLLGSPIAELTGTGSVTRHERYTPYGEPSDQVYDAGPGYTGHVTDASTGLTYAQQRYYDPVLGRFLSPDPVAADANTGGNFNRYWYANNNPYKFTDPDGRLSDTWRNLLGDNPDVVDGRARFAVEQAADSLQAAVQHQIDTAPRQAADAASLVFLAASVHPLGIGSQTTRGGVAIGKVAMKLSNRQFRHIIGHIDYKHGGYFASIQDAQKVLKAFHSGSATVLGLMKNGNIMIKFAGVTGTHVSRGVAMPTNLFMIKGTTKPSIVPINPYKTLP